MQCLSYSLNFLSQLLFLDKHKFHNTVVLRKSDVFYKLSTLEEDDISEAEYV